jgi:hypothetical protein
MDRIHRNSRNFTMKMDFLRSWNKDFNSTQRTMTPQPPTAIRYGHRSEEAQLESEQSRKVKWHDPKAMGEEGAPGVSLNLTAIDITTSAAHR